MTDHGMPFTSALIAAILEGRKTHTRRPITKHNSTCGSARFDNLNWNNIAFGNDFLSVAGRDAFHRVFPRIQPGDRIWVRETYSVPPEYWGYMKPREFPEGINFIYKQESPDYRHKELGTAWIPSIHMPKHASRIWLEVISVKPEHVQDITPDECYDEGIFIDPPAAIDPKRPDNWDNMSECRKQDFLNMAARAAYIAKLDLAKKYVDAFAKLWNGVYGNWKENPLVWRYEFRRTAL